MLLTGQVIIAISRVRKGLLNIHLYSPMNGRKNAKQYTKRCNNLNYT